MSIAEEAKKILSLASSGLHGLETIGEIVKPLLAQQADTATLMTALHAIAAIVDTIKNGFDGTVSVDAVYAAISDTKSQLADNDRRADGDLDSRFPK